MAHKKGTSHTDQLHRMSRIEGQVRGIAKMIEEQRYCIDIVTQIKAIRSALNSVEKKIVAEHMHHCLESAIHSKNSNESRKMVDEIIGILEATGK